MSDRNRPQPQGPHPQGPHPQNPQPHSPPAVREAGLRAATALARDLGLGEVRPQVLSDRGSLMVRLPGAGLVARVSTHTAAQRRDPARWLAREVAVGRLAQAVGAPVVPPGEHAGPHLVEGLWVSLWRDVGDGDGSRATPEESAAALAEWHRLLGDAGRDLPVLPVVHELVTEPLEYAARLGQLDPVTHAALVREHEDALTAIEGLGSREVLLHGDAHRGNLLRAGQTWLWGDLEEACRGPIEWDLAVLGSTPTDEIGRAALAAYGAITGHPVPTPEDLAPWLRLRTLEATAWLVGCAVTFPERYAEPARRHVDQILGRAR